MSESKAIKAVTERLQTHLQDAGLTATARPLDKPADSELNLFLYQVSINPAWRNTDLPTATSRGQNSRPLLPLNLYYLLSALEDDNAAAHEKLGKAMLVFHDRPALRNFNPDSGIKNQTDPVRVTLQAINIDEMSKLWSAFQTPYRISAAYEVGVVLIESELPGTSPAPVLQRGEAGTGWDSSTQFPAVLTSVQFGEPEKPLLQPGARLGDKVRLIGHNLNQSGTLQVNFQHTSFPELPKPLSVDAKRRGESEVEVTVPNEPNSYPPGVYMVSLTHTTGSGSDERKRSSNSIPISVLPEIEVPADGLKVTSTNNNQHFLVIPCSPKMKVGQRVQVLIGSVTIDSVNLDNLENPKAEWTTPLGSGADVIFPKGEEPFARLRVDGVESLIFDPANPEQGFDPKLVVKFPE